MKKIRLNKLVISNFMGCEEYSFTPGGESVIINGANRTGKTTLAHAFSWVFSGKDSLGNSAKSFDLKPFRPAGVGVCPECSVSAEITTDNIDNVTFRRAYCEKRNKRRQLTGHTTKYFIDDLKVSQSDYNKAINKIVPVDKIDLISRIGAFHSLAWDKRRILLSDLCGVSGDLLAEESDNKKRLMAELKVAQKEYADVPVQIEEVRKGLVETRDAKVIKECKARAKAKLETAGNVNANTQALKDIDTIDLKISKLKAKEAKYLFDLNSKALEVIEKARVEHDNMEAEIRKGNSEIDIIDLKIASLNEVLNNLRVSFKTTNDSHVEVETECPYCNQSIPQADTDKIISDYNLNKSKILGNITLDGKLVKSKIGTLQEERATLDKALDKVREDSWIAFDNLDDAKVAQENLPKKTYVDEFDHLGKCRAELKASLKVLPVSDVESLEKEIGNLDNELFTVRANNDILLRVEKLKRSEKTSLIKLESIEGKIDAINSRILEISGQIEDQVNDRFDQAKFKMFESCINGNVNPCCKTLVNNVGYDRGLNTGNRLQCDIEIATKFSEFFGVSMPLFIDNAESVTDYIGVDAQTFKLFANWEDKTLRIESDI